MTVNGSAAHGNLKPGHFLFTSESVGEGHPGMLKTRLSSSMIIYLGSDKICDQISDSIVSVGYAS